MGQRGPLPRPGSSESIRRRNTLYRRTKAAPAVPVAPPAFLEGNDSAHAFWHDHATALIAAGRLRPEHATLFGVLAEIAGETRAVTAMIAAEGMLVKTRRGHRAHPACRILRDLRRDFVALARDFGLTASSAARFPQDEPDDDIDQDEADLRAFTG